VLDESTTVRLSVVGIGTVGTWVLETIASRRAAISERYGIELQVVALASRRDGFVYRPDGIDIDDALATRRDGGSLGDVDGVSHWPTALEGLEAAGADVLVEVTQSPASDGEPGLSHIRTALAGGASVATSNKWPVALAGLELSRLAEANGLGFRAESTVMSGTPVLSTLIAGIAGTDPVRLRGVLNASANVICSRVNDGVAYEDALAEARSAGLTEPDPTEDVDGHDSVAKLMILSALVFGRQLEVGDVSRRGVAALSEAEVEDALARGTRIREVSTLDPGADLFSVEPVAVGPDDPLFHADGTTNTVALTAEPLGEVAVSGPGAGPKLAGQGVLSDLIALARAVRARASA
jgi:homoserine dehydrogenase